jgi:hypothetical protein
MENAAICWVWSKKEAGEGAMPLARLLDGAEA